MAARSDQTIQTDTLARILAKQGHIDDARAMLNHLQSHDPKSERDETLAGLDRDQRKNDIQRLQRLLQHIRARSSAG